MRHHRIFTLAKEANTTTRAAEGPQYNGVTTWLF